MVKKNKSFVFQVNYIKLFTLCAFLGIALLFLGIYIYIAKGKYEPNQISLSTISANSFTVSFFTDWEVQAEMYVSQTKNFAEYKTFYDERDYEVGRTNRNSHVMVARGLEPETKYYFKIKTFINSKYEEEKYSLTTYSVTDEVPIPIPIFGEVVDKNNKSAADVLVDIYAKSDVLGTVSTKITTYTNWNGTYSADLANLMNMDGNSRYDLEQQGVRVVIEPRTAQEAYILEISKDNVTPAPVLKMKPLEDQEASTSFFVKTNQLTSNLLVSPVNAENGKQIESTEVCEQVEARAYDWFFNDSKCETRLLPQEKYFSKIIYPNDNEDESSELTIVEQCNQNVNTSYTCTDLQDHTYGLCMKYLNESTERVGGSRAPGAIETYCGLMAKGVRYICENPNDNTNPAETKEGFVTAEEAIMCTSKSGLDPDYGNVDCTTEENGKAIACVGNDLGVATLCKQGDNGDLEPDYSNESMYCNGGCGGFKNGENYCFTNYAQNGCYQFTYNPGDGDMEYIVGNCNIETKTSSVKADTGTSVAERNHSTTAPVDSGSTQSGPSSTTSQATSTNTPVPVVSTPMPSSSTPADTDDVVDSFDACKSASWTPRNIANEASTIDLPNDPDIDSEGTHRTLENSIRCGNKYEYRYRCKDGYILQEWENNEAYMCVAENTLNNTGSLEACPEEISSKPTFVAKSPDFKFTNLDSNIEQNSEVEYCKRTSPVKLDYTQADNFLEELFPDLADPILDSARYPVLRVHCPAGFQPILNFEDESKWLLDACEAIEQDIAVNPENEESNQTNSDTAHNHECGGASWVDNGDPKLDIPNSEPCFESESLEFYRCTAGYILEEDKDGNPVDCVNRNSQGLASCQEDDDTYPQVELDLLNRSENKATACSKVSETPTRNPVDISPRYPVIAYKCVQNATNSIEAEVTDGVLVDCVSPQETQSCNNEQAILSSEFKQENSYECKTGLFGNTTARQCNSGYYPANISVVDDTNNQSDVIFHNEQLCKSPLALGAQTDLPDCPSPQGKYWDFGNPNGDDVKVCKDDDHWIRYTCDLDGSDNFTPDVKTYTVSNSPSGRTAVYLNECLDENNTTQKNNLIDYERYSSVPMQSTEVEIENEIINNKAHSLSNRIFSPASAIREPQVVEDSMLETKSGDLITPGTYSSEYSATLNFTRPTFVNFFNDINSNGTRDPGEENIEDRTFQLVKTRENFKISVQRGWNAVTFSTLKDKNSFYKASEIIDIANSQGVFIDTIKKWDGKWYEYTIFDGVGYGTDFNILPNQGYFIFANASDSFDLFGKVNSKSYPIQLNSGWNLIGVNGGFDADLNQTFVHKEFEQDEIYAFQFIEVINNTTEGVNITNMTRWDNGVYRGVNSQNGKEFGIDFKIRPEAYFIRSDKKAVFTP